MSVDASFRGFHGFHGLHGFHGEAVEWIGLEFSNSASMVLAWTVSAVLHPYWKKPTVQQLSIILQTPTQMELFLKCGLHDYVDT
ncbi:hypothetical protein SCUP234_11169 [Seiridium cupressi]